MSTSASSHQFDDSEKPFHISKYFSLSDVIEPKSTTIIYSLEELLDHLKWSPFSFFIIIVQSMQWAITAQMFVMTAYLTPSGKTVANGTYTSVRDEWPNEPRYFVWIDSYELISASEFAGNIFFGMIPNLLSDRYGRRAVLVAVLFGITIATTACALAPNFWFLILSRFFQGAFLNAMFSLNFVHCMESETGQSRFLATCCFGLFWTFGYCVIAPTALVIGSWRWILGVNAIAALFCAIIQLMLVPESPCFCVAQNDRANLENFVVISKLLNRSSYEVDYDAIFGKKIFESIEELDVNSIGTIFKYLFKNRNVCIVLIVICYAEFATFLSYAGISFDSTSLEVGNSNWIFILSGLVEFPAYCVFPKLLDWFPCKVVMVAVLSSASASLLALRFIPEDLETLLVVFWLLSKLLATSCYVTILIATLELFPTKYRASAVGLALTFPNVSSILAPHFGHLTEIRPDLAFLLFGVALALASILSAIFIPMKTKFEP